MKIDITPYSHAGMAAAVQIIVGLLTSNWWVGGLVMCTWWAAREHTQAEYRWIERFGNGKRANMPEWGGFDRRVWDKGSVLDFCVPGVVSLSIWLMYLLLK